MACYHPKDAWRVYYPEYGITNISFRVTDEQKAISDHIPIPCRKCIGCRLDHAQAWTVRIMHEAQMASNSTFISLTYSDEHLPKDGEIAVAILQKFIKRLRKRVKIPIRHYSVGEYGDNYGRPHYHCVIFGYDFPDRAKHKYDQNTQSWSYTSEELSKTWPYGYSIIQDLVLGNAAYIARYVTKKLSGDNVDKYKGKKPEFACMSRKPGIGATWFNQFYTDLYPSDFVIIDGKRFPIPAYYDKLMAETDEVELFESKDWRIYEASQIPEDTILRLSQREEFHTLKAQSKTRDFYDGN